MPSQIYTAPPDSGAAVLGRTLPSLLYDAPYPSNPSAFNQPTGDGWTPLSTDDFRTQAEDTALGLLTLGLERGSRVGMFMESDVPFCVADMGCLIAGFIDVPIYLTSSPEAIEYVIGHAEAQALFVSSGEHLAELADLLHRTSEVKTIIVAEPGVGRPAGLPDGIQVMTMAALQERGQARRAEDENAIQQLLDEIEPHDVATLIYTSGTTGTPKGVVLTHENISYNGLTS
ncbi:MAG: AMP-binding protein, partial [Rhodothermales bacterium]